MLCCVAGVRCVRHEHDMTAVFHCSWGTRVQKATMFSVEFQEIHRKRGTCNRGQFVMQ